MTDRMTFDVGAQPRLLGIVLAGGEGKRLWPLTADRAKPAVPFGGTFRIIDFVLSNFVNSGIHRIKVLTQYKSDSLLSHLSRGWRLSPLLDHYIEPVPPQQRVNKQWFLGSADAIYQSLNLIADDAPDFICVFGGDHIYKMDVRQMLAWHINKQADLTVAAVPVPVQQAQQFGVIEVDENWRMCGFVEKPDHPKEIPGRPGWALASMGNYIFKPDVLRDAVTLDAQNESAHDFGRNIVPALYSQSRVFVYDFTKNRVPGATDDECGYWRDVGTIENYWEATMDLVAVKPVLNLYNDAWPIHTWLTDRAPAKFVFADHAGQRVGFATDSIVSPGCIVSGGHVHRSVLFSQVRINSYAHVEECVLMPNVEVGRHCRIRRAIIDKRVKIPPYTQIGFDREADQKRFFVSPEGIIVIPKGFKFEKSSASA